MYDIYFIIMNNILLFRSIGSDISIGQCLLNEMTEIGPFEIALLRSVGCEDVCVFK